MLSHNTWTEESMNRNLVLLLITYFAFITIGMTASILNIAWVYIEDTFQLSIDSLGILLTAGMIGRLSAAFLNGRILSSVSMGTFLVGGCVIGASGAFGYVIAPLWLTLLFAAFLLNVGEGVLDAGMNTFVSAHYQTSHMNWLHAFFGVGLTIGPLLVTFIVIDLEQSWRVSYIVAAIFQLFVGVIILLTISDWKANKQIDTTTPTAQATMQSTLRLPMVWFGMLLFFVYGGVEIGGGQLTNNLLTQGRGIDQATASRWISIYWGSFTIGRMIMGFLASRISNNILMRTSMLSSVLGTALLWANVSNTFSFLGLAVLGFSLAPVFPTLISETPRRVGSRHTANTIGFQVGVTSLGGAIIPGLAGNLAEIGGMELIPLVLVVNAVVGFLLHEWILLREAKHVATIAVSSD